MIGRFLSFVSILMLVSMIIVATGCRSEKNDTIKIGAVFALKGKAESLGIPERNAVKLIEKQVNSQGGIKLPDGKKVKLEIVVEDTETSAAKAKTKIQKLIDSEKVIALIGPSTSGESLGIIADLNTQKKEIVLVSCGASHKIVADPAGKSKWVFKTPQSDSMAVEWIKKYLIKKGLKKVAIASSADGFGKSGLAEIMKILPQGGQVEIVSKIEYDRAATSVTSQVNKIMEAKPQAIINWDISQGAHKVAKALRDGGHKIPLIMSHGVANQTFIKLAGAAAEGVVFPAGKMLIADKLNDSDPQKKLLNNFINDYKKEYKVSPSTFAGHSYDALWLLITAIEKAGLEKAKIRDAIENVQFVGTAGIFRLNQKDHLGLKSAESFVMIEIAKGTDGKLGWKWLSDIK